MARAHYIYLVRLKASGRLLGAFTVKHEAHTWAELSEHLLDALQLSSMRDGINEKTETPRDW